MNKLKLLLFMVSAALLLSAGCAKQQQFKAVEQICVPKVDKLTAMEATDDVLSKMHFTIDKADAEQGLIRTKPLTGAQFFEFWRSDNVGAFNSAEANLHSIRRIVELHISQQDGKVCIDCDVKVQRLNLPECQVNSSAQAYKMFSKSKSSMQKLEINERQREQMAWVDLGKDARMATEILKRISSILDARLSLLDIENPESRMI